MMKTNRSNSRGATLLEVFIGLAIVGVICAICFSACFQVGRKAPMDIEAQARSFMEHQTYKVLAVSCASLDSDGDGYVSCTVTVDNDGHKESEQVECAAEMQLRADGCRLQPSLAKGRRQR